MRISDLSRSIIDQKGDLETIEQFTKYVTESDRLSDLSVFSLGTHDKSSSYNLLNNGSATELRDRILGALVWSEEFYKNQSSGFLLSLLIGLVWLRENRSLKLDFGVILKCTKSPDFVLDLAMQIPEENEKIRFHMEESHLFLKGKDSFNSLQGLRVQLSSIVYSDFGDRILSKEDSIDLFETVRQGKIVFMFLDTRRYRETARSIGRFIVQDLKSVSARIDSEVPLNARKSFCVIVDEFADLADEEFVGFLDRARSSRMGVVVAHQEISDLDSISHELRNPLTPLRNALYLLDACGPHEAQVDELHRMMGGQLEHLVRLVDDLLDVSRITRGKIELKWERVETGKLAEDVLNNVRPLILERGHDLRVTLPTEKTYLRGDRVRLTQVLVNLLTNAAKYTPPSGRIWVTVEAEPTLLVFRIRDTGIGLDPSDVERIFNLFEHAGHAQDTAKGG